MNISIKHLQHFIAVAEELHFRRAAQITNVAQPALSRSVQTLENELGVLLFERNNRGVKLTAAGEAFLIGSKKIAEDMQTTIDTSIRANKHDNNTVNIGYNCSAIQGLLPQAIQGFEKQNPTISIDAIAGRNRQLLDKLHGGTIDCCFHVKLFNNPLPHTDESVLVQQDKFIVAVSQSHPFANRESVSIEELADEILIRSFANKNSLMHQYINQLLKKANVTPNIKWVEHDEQDAFGQVALNHGVIIGIESCIPKGELRSINITGTNATLPTMMTWKKSLRSESALQFRDFMLHSLERNEVTKAHEPETDLPAPA